MRRRNQAQRRQQLARAARQVLLERGAVGLRVKDVAERAGLAPSSVLYYYPNLDELLIEVSRGAIERFTERRAAAVRRLDGARDQLRLAIHLGVPSGPDDVDSRILYELDAFTGSSPAFGILTASYFDRQAVLYESILDAGARTGDFELTADALTVARGLVAMEDGLGLQVVIAHPAIDRSVAEEILVRYAETAIGAALPESPSAAAAADH
ncbi:MAG TPA: TetR/AcrR family transcriptional regulator [Solirubrobacterales bacterium]|nr:TetR/AcrR family transcriptional regulator [Solirubrobacterales bacterium]